MAEAPSTASIEEDIVRLETRLRQLKVQYDMFFNGALSREPYELRADVERMIKRYANAPIRKYHHRFHFNSLVSRFNSLSELWTKTLRTLEEGDRPAPRVARDDEEVLTTCRIHDPVKEQELLRFLHSRFLEARRKMGGANGKGRVSFKDFVRGVASQASSLRKKSGCDEIELRLIVVDRKVQLKARPGR